MFRSIARFDRRHQTMETEESSTRSATPEAIDSNALSHDYVLRFGRHAADKKKPPFADTFMSPTYTN